MVKILHLIEGLSFGGAARGVFAAAKYSSKLGDYQHTIMPISVAKSDLGARRLAEESGVQVVVPENRAQMMAEIAAADVVQLNWWNSPDVDAFIRSSLPATRLVGWLHVGGHVAPQVVVPNLIDYLDIVVPTSPHALAAPAIAALPAQARRDKVALAYGPADFARLSGFTPRPHTGFNIGYIGTVSFIKMHPDFVQMSAPVDIPGVKFVICGSGGAEAAIVQQARQLGAAERFDLRGYVQDIQPILETMDAYGYPLCPETYASSELNLQEVMYAGIPPVVFPSGGIRELVINDVTGYIVHSAQEYKEALEHLYRNPQERARIGAAARQYAIRIFGAENAAARLNAVYDRLMQQPKRTRRWSADIAPGVSCGAEAFALSLTGTKEGDDFWESLKGKDLTTMLAAERRISSVSRLVSSGGLHSYRDFYKSDPHLWFWSGLISLTRQDFQSAAHELLTAAQLGFNHWRVLWYLALAAQRIGETSLVKDCTLALERAAPGFAAKAVF